MKNNTVYSRNKFKSCLYISNRTTAYKNEHFNNCFNMNTKRANKRNDILRKIKNNKRSSCCVALCKSMSKSEQCFV